MKSTHPYSLTDPNLLPSRETREERESEIATAKSQSSAASMGAAEAPALVAPAAGVELERRVMAAVKASEARGDPPLLRAVEVARLVAGEGAGLPSAELAGILVSNLCFAHNTASLWKLLDQAMSSRLLCPLHVLALLTARVLPQRRAQPEAYRLYLELLKSNVTSSSLSLHAGPNRDKMTKSIDAALQLSKIYGVSKIDFGHVTAQAINEASWQETFKALWIAALRLVQRAREPLEGPLPHLDARLCMLLAIIPLAIAAILKEETDACAAEGNKSLPQRLGLVYSLQDLVQYSGLLVPPASVVNVANAAASKAAVFRANYNAGGGNPSMIVQSDSSMKAVGNMLHLIVEACISRNLIDTTAYLWPGYVILSGHLKDTTLPQESPWLNFMQGAPLSDPLKNALISTPASRYMVISYGCMASLLDTWLRFCKLGFLEPTRSVLGKVPQLLTCTTQYSNMGPVSTVNLALSKVIMSKQIWFWHYIYRAFLFEKCLYGHTYVVHKTNLSSLVS
uniref:Uncharacterized protein n=1 Tax=Avena sativa TaxID=4498 RepID=A0ACD5WSK8_AVESA